jgi:CBS domain-containing protein
MTQAAVKGAGDIKRARDIMTKNVITVSPETSVEDLGRLFIEKNISGVPVVQSDGSLYGIVTENDLISKERPFHIPTIVRIFDAFISIDGDEKVEREIIKMAAAVVDHICTREVVTVGEDATIQDIAGVMADKKAHILPVLRDGRLVGIIGKKDMIRAIAGL